MLNQITIMGRLTKDPELRRTQSGTAVTSFTLAVDRDFKEQDGNRKTDFIECVGWRGTAEFIVKHLNKGRAVVVDGRLQIREWKDKDGNNRNSAEVIVDSVYFADSKPNAQDGNYSAYAADVAKYKVVGVTAEDLDEIEEDDGDTLPF